MDGRDIALRCPRWRSPLVASGTGKLSGGGRESAGQRTAQRAIPTLAAGPCKEHSFLSEFRIQNLEWPTARCGSGNGSNPGAETIGIHARPHLHCNLSPILTAAVTSRTFCASLLLTFFTGLILNSIREPQNWNRQPLLFINRRPVCFYCLAMPGKHS